MKKKSKKRIFVIIGLIILALFVLAPTAVFMLR
jgi:hypothetical protein